MAMATESSISSREMTRAPQATATSCPRAVLDENILRLILDHHLDQPVCLPRFPTDMRYSLMLVCKTWKAVVSGTPHYWNRFAFDAVPVNSSMKQLSLFHTYVKRTQGAQMSLFFATEKIKSRECGKPNIVISPKTNERGKLALKKVYGHGSINIVDCIVLPYAGRVYELHCLVANYPMYQSLSGIGADVLMALQYLDISLIDPGPKERRSDMEAGYMFDFQAFSKLPQIYMARIQITSGIHPLDLRLPWHLLTKLDLIDTILPAHTMLRILHRCSAALVHGYFTIDLNDPMRRHARPFSIRMKSLLRFRLRTLHAEQDNHFERGLSFPVLKFIWIEKAVGLRMHKWDIPHYTSLLAPCSTTLIQLMFSNLSYSLTHRQLPSRSSLGFPGRTSCHALEDLFKALPNVEDLRFPTGIYIHPPTLERIGTGELLPRLTTLEIATLFPDVICSVAQRRNGVEAGPSDLRLRCSAIQNLYIVLPTYLMTKQEEITKWGRELDLGMTRGREALGEGLLFKFMFPCICGYCFGC